jgi:hypothetical protein
MSINRLNEVLTHHPGVYIRIIISLFIITRIFFLLTPDGRFGDADQAVFGMMAQRITLLKEFPIFCWEAHYAGTPVAYVAAIIFKLFGAGFVQLRLAMIMIILPGVILFYFIYQRLFGSHKAFVGVLFLVFCPYVVLNSTMAAYGGYGESFVGTALIILLGWKIKDQTMNTSAGVSYFLLGLICGFFVYVHFYVIPAILVFAIPLLWQLGEKRVKSFGQFCLGGLIGSLPLIIYNFQNSGGTLTRAAAWILLIGRDDISATPIQVVSNIFLKKSAYLTGWFSNAPLMFGQYVVPAVFGHTIQITGGGVLIIIFAVYIISYFREINKKELVGFYHYQFALYLLVFILFQWVASLYADRHFMPIFFVIPIAVLSLTKMSIKSNQVSVVILLLLSLLQVIGWHQEFNKVRGFDPRPVIKIMESRGIRGFYSSYWTGYPIMFLGEGRLIGSPMLLPYHEPFSDRRPHYTMQVDQSRDSAFLFGEDEKMVMNEFLSFLKIDDITFELVEVDGISIFYHLSKPVGVSFIKKDWTNYFFLK